MKPNIVIKKTKQVSRSICALVLFAAVLMPWNAALFANTARTVRPTAQEGTKIPPEQLDSLVAPIALYPDNLLSQTLVASTYPLEIVQLYQWLEKNKDLQKDQKKLAEKVAKQPWDPSIQAMAPLPDVVKFLAEDITWTTDLGNAFLAQQKDVMAAVQRMRAKAQEKGALKTNEQMKVETQKVESQTVIVIEQSNPQVVYVPSYDPVVVYGPPVYPYPPVAYPAGGYVAAGLIGFGVGVAIGAAWGGGWGWGCGWGGGDVDINVNNNFNRNTNIQGGNRVNNAGGGNKWQHNPTHRGGAPYGDRGTANKFGGTTRGDSLSNRQKTAQRDLGNRGSVSDRGGAGVGDRSNAGANRPSASDRSNAGANRGGASDRSSMGGSRGGDSIGNRSASSSSRGSSSFGGGRSDGFSGSSSRSSSSRGMSSMSSSRGGFSGGGGGGMSRGGGGGGGRRR